MAMSLSTVVHLGNTTEPTYVISASCSDNQSTDDGQLLQLVNDRKATLLLPAIFITVILLIMGLIGNPLALYIYGWRWQSSTTKIFLTCLAVVDLMNCLITIPTEIMIMRNFYNFSNDGWCKVSRFTTYVMNNATVVVFMAIAVDRYVRICHPHRKPMSRRSAKIACGVGIVVGLLVGWPALILYGRIEVPVPVSYNPPRFVTGAMCLVHSDMQGYTLAFFTYLCSASFICAIILIVFYTLIGRTILKRKRIQRQRKEATAAALENLGARGDMTELAEDSPRLSSARSSRSPRPSPSPGILRHSHTNGHSSNCQPDPPTTSQTEKLAPDHDSNDRGCNMNSFRKCGKKLRPPRATLMLFLITIVYIISFLPFLIISIIRQHRGAAFYPSLNSTEQVFVNIFLRSYLVNNCSNPVVYGICNSMFRNECKLLYRRLFRKTAGSTGTDSLKSRTLCETPRQERRGPGKETPRQERKQERFEITLEVPKPYGAR